MNLDRCEKCKHKDIELSNDNWLVCDNPMPVDVALSQDSSECKAYKEKENNNGR